MAKFEYEIPDYGDKMTVAAFRRACRDGLFTDYDGHGNPAKNDRMMDTRVYPSSVCDIPKEATHIVWFNR